MRHCVFTLNSEQTQTRFRAALNRLCKDALKGVKVVSSACSLFPVMEESESSGHEVI